MPPAVKSLWERKRWSDPGSLRVPLWVTLVLVVVAQVAGSYAWGQARRVNARWLEAESPYVHDSPRATAADVMLRNFSETIADHSCEIGRPTVCDKTEAATSPALTAVDVTQLPAVSRNLLEQNGYSSADHLLVALLFNGQEAAVPGTLAALVRTGKLAPVAVHRFLYDWFLSPAVVYYREGRAEDAAALFLGYIENELAALNSGTRLSGLDDVDVTDLPVLFEGFCRGPGTDSPSAESCAIPFLHSISTGQSTTRFWDPMGTGIPNFLRSYRQAVGSSLDLVAYLDMERRVGEPNSPVESWSPDGLPVQARYLGHFAKGRHLAATLGTGPACGARMEAALTEYRRVGSLAPPHYFMRAVQDAVDDLTRRPQCGPARA
jgi:hypothetical protein